MISLTYVSEFLQAFEHVLQRGLVCFADGRGRIQSTEFRPVKLLVSFAELSQGLKAHHSCPVSFSVGTVPALSCGRGDLVLPEKQFLGPLYSLYTFFLLKCYFIPSLRSIH